MKKLDPVTWVLHIPMIPLFGVIHKNKGEPNPETNLIVGIYGYLVFCGVLFNLGVFFACLMELTK